jgi:hypothetical protein
MAGDGAVGRLDRQVLLGVALEICGRRGRRCDAVEREDDGR